MKQGSGVKPQSTKPKPKSIKSQYTALIKEMEGLKDQYLRVLAEFDNYRKRRERDFIVLRENANISLIEDLLPILDDFERSLTVQKSKQSLKSFYEGAELIYSKLKSILENRGLAYIEASGKPFDPELHEAILQIESKDHLPNFVVEEVLKGYKIRDKVIRHSKVVVNK